MRSKFSQGMPRGRTAAWRCRLGGGLGGARAGVAQPGLCTAFPQTRRRRRLRDRGDVGMGCRSHQLPLWMLRGCTPPPPPLPAQAGQRLLGITRAWHSHRAKVGALVPSSHGHPHGVWLCPAPPSPGWGYSQPQLLLSSFSPAASRNSGCLGGCSCVGRAGGPSPPPHSPGPSGCATSPMSHQTRCFISPRCTRSAPATSP